MTAKISIFIDGATENGRNKKGKTQFGGIGVFCPYLDFKYAARIPCKSSFEAEFIALILALRWAYKMNQLKVKIFTDCKPLVAAIENQTMNNGLMKFYKIISEKFEIIELSWLKRENNAVADRLAKFYLSKT